ncbi:Stress response protein YvgO [Sarcoptes scabiei]|uniref:Stress response protein YvgO n=1 Tax=Sarcoptes scabiei TaxID=52283 RepID=A0A132AGG2_SARSC|nr:Stress response protein YvgO [Sarcoptes scabiei]KPM10078.1 hypothetical protein QR98_0086260 [Sarcoptes scabiei]UXI23058.1 hypothetical protein NH340_JMT09001 [Sarcoptes scabiei]
MRICHLQIAWYLLSIGSVLIFKIETAPIVPILTAIAASAVGLFQIQIDTLHIAKYLRDASHHKKNRGAFVRDLLYTAFYRSGQSYNVMVFNLAEPHRHRLRGVNFYGSVTFTDNTRYGIWVFRYGMFENQGARGWHNWGMIGSFTKSKDGATIYFHRRHHSVENDETTTTSTTTLMPTESIARNSSEINDQNLQNSTTSDLSLTEMPSSAIPSSSTTSTTMAPLSLQQSTILLRQKDLQDLVDNGRNPSGNNGNDDDGDSSRIETIKHKISIKIDDNRSGSSKVDMIKKILPKIKKFTNNL